MPVSAYSLLGALVILSLFFQPACSKKSKAPVAGIGPTRVVLLPFNVSVGNADLKWASMAAPIVLAKVSERASDLVVIPLWETMPTAIQAAGASRSFTEESASSVAAWLSAKWSIMGDLSPGKRGILMTADFIPAKSNQVPFRYLKIGQTDSSGFNFTEAYRQFLRYLVAKPLESAKGNEPSLASMKALAETLDREYGWFVEASPGKAQEVVTELARTDGRLARLLFNPSLYPSLSQTTK